MPHDQRGSDLFLANDVVVRLRNRSHEAAVEKTRRQLAAASLRKDQWGPAVAWLVALAAIGLVTIAWSAIGGVR